MWRGPVWVQPLEAGRESMEDAGAILSSLHPLGMSRTKVLAFFAGPRRLGGSVPKIIEGRPGLALQRNSIGSIPIMHNSAGRNSRSGAYIKPKAPGEWHPKEKQSYKDLNNYQYYFGGSLLYL